jgi:IS5 family transposase
MKQAGMFEMDNRLGKIDSNGDPLVKLNEVIDWELFRPELERVRQKERKSNAGRKPYDAVMMFKVLVVQSLYNLADDAVEFQILDRLSFMRFLGLSIGDSVPDAKTVWLFREELREAGVIEKLFARFDRHLRDNGFSARKGQIIDASIVSAPAQRNTGEENEALKAGLAPEWWSEEKLRQKDVDARWTKKGGRSYFGYKNHMCVDVKHKLIRGYEVTDASVHDSRVFEDLLDEGNTSRDVWADAAYRSEGAIENMEADGYREHIQRKGVRGKELTEWEKQGNRTRAKTRARIEHVFGVQAKRAGCLIVRTIGIWRARAKIGLRNLAYNLDRYGTLKMAKA